MSNRIPFLLSNVEVMNILHNRMQQRHKNDNNNNRNGNNSQQQHQQNRKLRHRDWIEDNVLQYCQVTSKLTNCTKAFELDTVLTKPKHTTVTLENTIDPLVLEKKMLSTATATSTSTKNYNDGKLQPENDRSVNDTNSIAAGPDTTTSPTLSVLYTGFGLTDAESIQIMNYAPNEMVEIHLMIEELQSRFTDTEQEVLLQTISKYTSETIPTSNVNNTSDTNAQTETNDILQDETNDDNGDNAIEEDEEEVVYEDYEENEPMVETHLNDINSNNEQQQIEYDNAKKRIKLEGNDIETNGNAMKRVKAER